MRMFFFAVCQSKVYCFLEFGWYVFLELVCFSSIASNESELSSFFSYRNPEGFVKVHIKCRVLKTVREVSFPPYDFCSVFFLTD